MDRKRRERKSRMKRIDGKQVSKELRASLAEEVAALKKQGITPGLCTILVGDDPASQTYVKSKGRACEAIGMYSEGVYLPADTTEEALLALIDEKNADPKIHGILVQLPLPKQIDKSRVIERISPDKDVDGFHPINVGRLFAGEGVTFKPCTPNGIMKLIESEGIEVAGMHAVVLGRSNIVGKPIGQMLLDADATVTICHSGTRNLAEITRQADLIVSAVGRKDFLRGDMVKEGVVVIDVGINRVDGKLYGDVNFDEVAPHASHITPVPGGVGPMTITMLLYNTVLSAKNTSR
jgi:methylenetetrahydrofolate dehydrogenase (NADP+)/methenyltetrahydrofolate cyclohydrolase